MVHQARLFEVLTEFARALVSEYRVGDLLYRLCDAAPEVLPVRGCGVMLADDGGHLRFVAASDERLARLEELQVELGEGPCLHAYRTGEQIIVPDVAEDGAFPQFRPRALEAGLRAVYSFPMRLGSHLIGAINLYKDRPQVFEDGDRSAGQLLADIAAAAVLNARAYEEQARLAAQLQHALDGRVVVEQAKGKLSEQLGVDMSAAFDVLRRYARNRGLKLHSVAEQVAGGELRLGLDETGQPVALPDPAAET